MTYEELKEAIEKDGEAIVAEQLWQIEKIIKQLTDQDLLEAGKLYTEEVERRLNQ